MVIGSGGGNSCCTTAAGGGGMGDALIDCAASPTTNCGRSDVALDIEEDVVLAPICVDEEDVLEVAGLTPNIGLGFCGGIPLIDVLSIVECILPLRRLSGMGDKEVEARKVGFW